MPTPGGRGGQSPASNSRADRSSVRVPLSWVCGLGGRTHDGELNQQSESCKECELLVVLRLDQQTRCEAVGPGAAAVRRVRPSPESLHGRHKSSWSSRGDGAHRLPRSACWDMATALRNLRVPVKLAKHRWAVAAGGVGALAVLGVVCWWWRSRRAPSRKRRGGQDDGEGGTLAGSEPLLQETDTHASRPSGELLEESSDSDVEEVLSRGALARLAAANAARAKQRDEAEAAKEFFSATAETQARADREQS